MASNLVLIIVIGAAVSFDFTNGFHDTAKAMATSIATGALKPIVAVLLSAALNFLGAFISIAIATTIAKGIVSSSATAGADGLFVV
jgi:PiT family inorganic phosphate transporter